MPDLAVRRPSVRILVTGGTLDKEHDPQREALTFPSAGRTHLPRMLEEARCDHPVVDTLMLKDSLEFDDADRARLVEALAAAPETAFVITHGTSTMGETARYLAGRADRFPAATVVLTGAMRPFSLAASDAAFNLGGAILAAQLAPPGVWGAMNGRLFAAEALRKNVEAGRFDL